MSKSGTAATRALIGIVGKRGRAGETDLQRQSMKLQWLILALVTVLLAGCSGSSEPTDRKGQESAFRRELGFQPGPEISEIKSRIVNVGDWWGHWLAFTYTSNVFEQIIRDGFKGATAEEETDGIRSEWEHAIEDPGPNAPMWWKSPQTITGIVYHKDNSRSGFARSFSFIWVDASNRMIYLHTSASD